MNKKFTLLLVTFLLIFGDRSANAQMLGDNVFLKGHSIEVGIAPNGGFGSTLAAPTTYHPYLGAGSFTFYDPAAGIFNTSPDVLGFVANYGPGGWSPGTAPTFGDFYLPGEPQEGWAIRIGGVVGTEAHAFIPNYEDCLSATVTGYTLGTGSGSFCTGITSALSGTNVGYSSTGRVVKGLWQGSFNGLSIRQTTSLDTSKLFFTVNVVITNTTAAPIDTIYYLRTVDPDNDETLTGNFTTINTIEYQLPNPGNKVLVSATGTVYTNAYVGLGTQDCRAQCMIYNTNDGPDHLRPSYSLDSGWKQLPAPGTTYGYIYAVGSVYTEDVGIGLEFNLGNLAPGDSTTLSYAYILNSAYIDSALSSTVPTFEVNDTQITGTLDSINLCSYAPRSISVTIPGGGFYNWNWQPDTFLASPSGVSNTIHSDSIAADITYTITGTNQSGGCDSIVYYLQLRHTTFTAGAITPISYCQGDAAVPLISPVTGLDTIVTWLTTASGGGATSAAPTPPTTIATALVYYVVDTVGKCYSYPIPDTVIIRPMPPRPALSDPNPYCQGQPFVAITTAGTDILWYPTATGPTGGTGSAIAPTVNTAVPQSDTFYATETVSYTTPNVISCESPRASLIITVLDSVVPSFNYLIHHGCKADTVLFTNTSRGGTRYVWQFGDNASDTATDPTHVYLLQDTFSVQLTAITLQCVDSTIQQVPLVHPLKSGFTFTPNIVCQKDTAAFTNTSIGTGLSYQWLFGNGVTDDSDVNPIYSYPNSGVYTVQLIATDFVPCHDTALGVVSIDSISSISMTVTDSVICKSSDITFTANFTSIGNTGETWYFGLGDSISNINPVTYAYDATGTYTVSVEAHFRTCRDTGMSRTFTIYPAPSVNLGGDTSICPGSASLTLGDNINGQTPGASWKWNTGQTTPSIIVTTPGKYYVTESLKGCTSTDTVTVQNNCYMDIPNVFTPNGDGINDYFYPLQYLTKGLTSFKMDIYNRWGQLIFQATALDGRGWDGKFNGMDQSEGVYVYVIDATFMDGQKEHHQGNVTLLR